MLANLMYTQPTSAASQVMSYQNSENRFDCWLPDSGYKQTGEYEIEVFYLYLKDEKYKQHYEISIPIE